MVTRVPLNAVVVHRDGKAVKAKAGVPFEFTQGEVADLEAIAKKKNRSVLRDPVNEGGAAGGVSPKVASDFAKLVQKAEEAAGKAAAKPDDEKLAKAAAKAKDAAVEFAAMSGLELPESLAGAAEL